MKTNPQPETQIKPNQRTPILSSRLYNIESFQSKNKPSPTKQKNHSPTSSTSQDYLQIRLLKTDHSSVLTKHKELSISNFKLSQTCNFEQLKNTRIKDYIQELNTKIEEVKYENDGLVFNNFQLDLEKELSEKTQKEIAMYCNEMKRKALNFDNTIHDYQTLLMNKNKEIEKTKREYESIIKQTSNENDILNKELDTNNQISNGLTAMIRQKEVKNEEILNEINYIKQVYEEKSQIQKMRFEKVEREMTLLQNKAFALQEEIKKGGSNGVSLLVKDKESQARGVEVDEKEKIRRFKKVHLVDIEDITSKIIMIEKENIYIENEINDKRILINEIKRKIEERKRVNEKNQKTGVGFRSGSSLKSSRK